MESDMNINSNFFSQPRDLFERVVSSLAFAFQTTNNTDDIMQAIEKGPLYREMISMANIELHGLVNTLKQVQSHFDEFNVFEILPVTISIKRIELPTYPIAIIHTIRRIAQFSTRHEVNISIVIKSTCLTLSSSFDLIIINVTPSDICSVLTVYSGGDLLFKTLLPLDNLIQSLTRDLNDFIQELSFLTPEAGCYCDVEVVTMVHKDDEAVIPYVSTLLNTLRKEEKISTILSLREIIAATACSITTSQSVDTELDAVLPSPVHMVTSVTSNPIENNIFAFTTVGACSVDLTVKMNADEEEAKRRLQETLDRRRKMKGEENQEQIKRKGTEVEEQQTKQHQDEKEVARLLKEEAIMLRRQIEQMEKKMKEAEDEKKRRDDEIRIKDEIEEKLKEESKKIAEEQERKWREVEEEKKREQDRRKEEEKREEERRFEEEMKEREAKRKAEDAIKKQREEQEEEERRLMRLEMEELEKIRVAEALQLELRRQKQEQEQQQYKQQADKKQAQELKEEQDKEAVAHGSEFLPKRTATDAGVFAIDDWTSRNDCNKEDSKSPSRATLDVLSLLNGMADDDAADEGIEAYQPKRLNMSLDMNKDLRISRSELQMIRNKLGNSFVNEMMRSMESLRASKDNQPEDVAAFSMRAYFAIRDRVLNQINVQTSFGSDSASLASSVDVSNWNEIESRLSYDATMIIQENNTTKKLPSVQEYDVDVWSSDDDSTILDKNNHPEYIRANHSSSHANCMSSSFRVSYDDFEIRHSKDINSSIVNISDKVMQENDKLDSLIEETNDLDEEKGCHEYVKYDIFDDLAALREMITRNNNEKSVLALNERMKFLELINCPFLNVSPVESALCQSPLLSIPSKKERQTARDVSVKSVKFSSSTKSLNTLNIGQPAYSASAAAIALSPVAPASQVQTLPTVFDLMLAAVPVDTVSSSTAIVPPRIPAPLLLPHTHTHQQSHQQSITPRSRATTTSNQKGNFQIVKNALSKICMAGAHYDNLRSEAFSIMTSEKSEKNISQFIILFSDSKTLNFKGLYELDPTNTELFRILGKGPKTVDLLDKSLFPIDKYFKYESAGRFFRALPSKDLTSTTDAIAFDISKMKRPVKIKS